MLLVSKLSNSFEIISHCTLKYEKFEKSIFAAHICRFAAINRSLKIFLMQQQLKIRSNNNNLKKKSLTIACKNFKNKSIERIAMKILKISQWLTI